MSSSPTARLRARVRALQEMGDACIFSDWRQLTDDQLWTEYRWVAQLDTGSFTPFYRSEHERTTDIMDQLAQDLNPVLP